MHLRQSAVVDMVLQWLELLPHSKKVLDSMPRLTLVFSHSPNTWELGQLSKEKWQSIIA